MNRKPWTTEETAFLAANYRENGRALCSEKLGRNDKSVAKKAQAMGLFDKRWLSEDDVKFVLANYWSMKKRDIAAAIKRSVSVVERVAEKNGLTRKNYHPAEKHCIDCGKKLANKYMDVKRCRPCAVKGENNRMWRGGVTPLCMQIRNALRKAWTLPVMARDNFSCQSCGNTGKNLQAHHINRFVDIRDEVMRKNNVSGEDLVKAIVAAHRLEDGVTLCKPCHREVHSGKTGELLENPNGKAEGNQQPSAGNVRNTVPAKVQRLGSEDVQSDNLPTSARTASLAG